MCCFRMIYIYLDRPSNNNDAMKRRIINVIESFQYKSLYTDTLTLTTPDEIADKTHEIIKTKIILLFDSIL